MKLNKTLLLLLFPLFLHFCKKKAKDLYVTTIPISDIQGFSAKSGGVITGEGVTEKGICWSASPNPDVGNDKTSEGAGEQRYESKITGLIPQRTYYIRAYAINEAGVFYGEEFSFTTLAPTGGQLIDYDGNHYLTVTIGSQQWMAENLKVTRYRNGDLITYTTGYTAWIQATTGAYCYYNNSTASANGYGALYNFYAVNDPRKIAPIGWHVATQADWDQLFASLGGQNTAGNKMRNASQWPSNAANTNASGFSALPAGYRNSGNYEGMSTFTAFWTGTSVDLSYARSQSLDNTNLYSSTGLYSQGLSVRCVKD